MAELSTDALVAHLQRRAGDSLRCVGHYTPDDWGIEYVREDVKAQHSTEEVEPLLKIYAGRPSRRARPRPITTSGSWIARFEFLITDS